MPENPGILVPKSREILIGLASTIGNILRSDCPDCGVDCILSTVSSSEAITMNLILIDVH